jgi:prephenate dehydrogenase
MVKKAVEKMNKLYACSLFCKDKDGGFSHTVFTSCFTSEVTDKEATQKVEAWCLKNFVRSKYTNHDVVVTRVSQDLIERCVY